MGMLKDMLSGYIQDNNPRLIYLMERCDDILDGWDRDKVELTVSGSPPLSYSGTVENASAGQVEIGVYINSKWVRWAVDNGTGGFTTTDKVANGTISYTTGALAVTLQETQDASVTIYGRVHVTGVREDIGAFANFNDIENSPYQNSLVELLGLKLRFSVEGTWSDQEALTRYLKNFYNVLSTKGTEKSFQYIAFFLYLYKNLSIVPLYSDDYDSFTAAVPDTDDLYQNGGTWFQTPHFRIVTPGSIYQILGNGDIGIGKRLWLELYDHLKNARPAHTVMTYGISFDIYLNDDDDNIPIYVNCVSNHCWVLDCETSRALIPMTVYKYMVMNAMPDSEDQPIDNVVALGTFTENDEFASAGRFADLYSQYGGTTKSMEVTGNELIMKVSGGTSDKIYTDDALRGAILSSAPGSTVEFEMRISSFAKAGPNVHAGIGITDGPIIANGESWQLTANHAWLYVNYQAGYPTGFRLYATGGANVDVLTEPSVAVPWSLKISITSDTTNFYISYYYRMGASGAWTQLGTTQTASRATYSGWRDYSLSATPVIGTSLGASAEVHYSYFSLTSHYGTGWYGLWSNNYDGQVSGQSNDYENEICTNHSTIVNHVSALFEHSSGSVIVSRDNSILIGTLSGNAYTWAKPAWCPFGAVTSFYPQKMIEDSSGNILMVGTEDDGEDLEFMKSTDLLVTDPGVVTKIKTTSNPHRIGIAIDSSDNLIAVGSQCRYIYRSTDGGASWVDTATIDGVAPKLYNNISGEVFCISDVFYKLHRDASLGYVFAKSTDSGVTWVSQTGTGIVPALSGNVGYACEYDGDFYVVLDIPGGSGEVRVYKYSVSGDSWTLGATFTSTGGCGAFPYLFVEDNLVVAVFLDSDDKYVVYKSDSYDGTYALWDVCGIPYLLEPF